MCGEQHEVPFKFEDIPEVVNVKCGYLHAVFFDVNGDLWVFGDNSEHQIPVPGVGRDKGTFKPVKVPGVSDICYISSPAAQTLVSTRA